MKFTANKISQILSAIGMRAIPSVYRSDANDEAREMIGTQSHYYDKDTMRYFHCNVKQVNRSANGVYMYTIARQDCDSDHNKAYVVTFHAFDGHCLEKAKCEGCGRVYLPTLAAAYKHRDEILDSLNEMDVLAAAVIRVYQKTARESKAADKAFSMLPIAYRRTVQK